MADFDRYGAFKANGEIEVVPFIPIKEKNTDKYIKFDKTRMRLDKLSFDYYGDPDYGWLIMQANPQYGSLEGLIPNDSILRIPFPLQETLNLYTSDIITYKEFY